MYYAGGFDDGKIVTGWSYITAENDEDVNRDGDGYWFYFKSNGKKIVDTDSKTINGKNTGSMSMARHNSIGTINHLRRPVLKQLPPMRSTGITMKKAKHGWQQAGLKRFQVKI